MELRQRQSNYTLMSESHQGTHQTCLPSGSAKSPCETPQICLPGCYSIPLFRWHSGNYCCLSPATLLPFIAVFSRKVPVRSLTVR